MKELKQISLGQDGIEYVRSCLTDAGKGLCARLLELPLSDGTAHGLVPEDTALERAKQFESGGLMSMGSMMEWLAQHVISLNKNFSGGMFVLQDAWGARPGDHHTEKIKSSMFFDNDSVYYIVPHKGINHDAAIQAFKDVGGYLFVGAFVNFRKNPQDLIDQTVDNNLLRQLAEDTHEIIVGAYDQEGLVIWRKNGSNFSGEV